MYLKNLTKIPTIFEPSEHCANITTDARGLVKAEIKEMFGLWMKRGTKLEEEVERSASGRRP